MRSSAPCTSRASSPTRSRPTASVSARSSFRSPTRAGTSTPRIWSSRNRWQNGSALRRTFTGSRRSRRKAIAPRKSWRAVRSMRACASRPCSRARRSASPSSRRTSFASSSPMPASSTSPRNSEKSAIDTKVIELRAAEVLPDMDQILKQVADSGEPRIDVEFPVGDKLRQPDHLRRTRTFLRHHAEPHRSRAGRHRSGEGAAARSKTLRR